MNGPTLPSGREPDAVAQAASAHTDFRRPPLQFVAPRRPSGATIPLFALISAVANGVAQAPPPGAPQRPDPMLLPQLVALPRGDRQIVVDGSLSDWPELPAIRIDDRRQLSGTANNAWIGPRDLGAQGFMLWDEASLHVAFVVRDEWHRALDAKSVRMTEIPAADSVVLTFDPDRDTRGAGNDPGRREDREFWLADEAARAVVQWDRLRGTARVLAGEAARVVVLHDKEQGLTTYEALLPWNEILPVGRRATAGLVLDVQIVVNDYDEATDSMPQTRAGLTFGCGALVDPGLLASLMLVADAGALQGVVPVFPPKPGTPPTSVPGAEHWQQWTAKLLQSPPAIWTGTGTPQECGGSKRLALLEELDEHCGRMPRVDFLELHHRIHRRMSREVAGLQARGLPLLWRQRLESVSKNAEDPVPAGSLRLFRLPMGGWLFRSPQRNFVVDAAGADVAEFLFGGIEFCALTQPLELTRRNDQLLLRMYFAEPPRPVFTHVAFHLPVVPMSTMTIVEPGSSHGSRTGARVDVLGHKLPDGAVPWTVGYRIATPGGPTVLIVGPDLLPGEVGEPGADVAILSPRNQDPLAVLQAAKPKLVVIDDVFTCEDNAARARTSLREIHTLQQAVRAFPSLVLAPGESWTVAKRDER